MFWLKSVIFRLVKISGLFWLNSVVFNNLKLAKWYWWASHSRIDSFRELARKIKRNREFILNTISFGLSNARIEATNNKIKLVIRRSYGFRNVDSMLDMIYLTCSDLKIPLPNRPFWEAIAV